MISIRWRLTTSLCLTVALLFVVAGFGVFIAMRDVLLDRFDETLTAKARALITASEIDDGDFEIDLTVQDFAGFGRGGDDYFEVRRRDGSLFLRSPSLLRRQTYESDFQLVDQPRDSAGRIQELGLQDGRSVRYYVQRIYPKDDLEERFQDLYLIVASPTRGMELQLRALSTILWIAGAVVLLVMVPLIGFGLNRGLRPLNRLSAEVRGIRPEDLDRRLPVEGLPGELVPMAAGLNRWLERLRDSFDRERRFTSHAAHELRTPLAELRAMAELGALDATGKDAENYAEIVTVADELGELLDKLVLLARADAGSQRLALEPVACEGVLATVLTRLEANARKRGITFETTIEDGKIETDPLLWQTIVQNLVANAVAHAPEGTVVRVKASTAGLCVRNHAPDLEEEDIPHLFERFWRKDSARSGYAHSGLGLAIVQSCCSLLGASHRAVLHPDDSLEVCVAINGESHHQPLNSSR